MQTYIFADRKQNSLGPLDKKYCPALLPVGGRAVIVHTIEDLVNAGIKQATIVISAQAYEIEKALGDGSRWGIKLNYLLSQGEEAPSTVLKRLGNKLGEQLLLIRGDMLRSPVTADLLDRVKHIDSDIIHAHSDNQPLGISYLTNTKCPQAMDKVCWPVNKLQNTTDKLINFNNTSYSLLESVEDVFEACKSIADNRFKNIQHTGYKTETGYIHGRNHKSGTACQLSEQTCLGDNAFVGDNVVTEGRVVIGNDVMVDNGAHLKDCVVFPDTYIGNNTNIENAVVTGNEIYRIDTGKSIHIQDDFLLSSLSNNSFLITDRLLGILLLVLSLPLWPVAALLAYMASPGEALQARHIVSNRKVYIDSKTHVTLKIKAYEWNTSFVLLRYLPWILCVINGDLRLIGANPDFITDDPILDLMNDSVEPPQLGLISTAIIELPSKTPVFEKRIHEIVYDKRRSFISDLVYVLASLRHLVLPATWRQHKNTQQQA